MPLRRLIYAPDRWWLAGGAIPAANCLEHVEFPVQAQVYLGPTVADGNPWTIAATTAWNGSDGEYVLDAETGRVILGVSTTVTGGNNGYFLSGTWYDVNLFVSGVRHVYFLICDAALTSAYRDAVNVGGSAANHPGFAGQIRWRSYYGGGNYWSNEVLKAAVFNVALDTAQRTALYNAMR